MSSKLSPLDELRYGVRRYLSIKSSYSPSFLPDDSGIAYISDQTGSPQIWTVQIEGEPWPQQLTIGQRVSFVSCARRRDAVVYGLDAGGDERFQLQMLEGGGESLTKLTDNPTAIHSWGDWSPDENSICYSSNARNPAFFDVYLQSTENGEAEMVYSQDGNNYPVSWSPDGSSVLFSRMHAPFNHDLYLLRLSDGTAERLTPHQGDAVYFSAAFDPSGKNIYCITDEGREFAGLARIEVATRSLSYLYTRDRELEGMALSNDGKQIALAVNDDGYSRLMLWDVGSEALKTVEIPSCQLGGFAWSNSDESIAFTLSSSTNNSDIWLYTLADGSLRRVTHSSTCGIHPSSFAREQLFRVKSFDGLDVPTYLYKPADEGPSPMLVLFHGGPEGQFRPGFSPLIQYFVHLGFVVLAPNFRGSTGYGRRFTHLDDVRNRMDTVKDSVAAVAQAQRLVSVDPKRIVAWGGSYGGFMVLGSLYSNPDLWAAGVDIVGISNFVTFLEHTGPWRRQLRIAEYGDPQKDRDFLESISPTNNAHLIKAPLMIIHGANDPRVPVGEASQIMETMQRLGREAHIIVFQDEGHGLVKLDNRIEGYSNAIGFLMSTLERVQ